jgi:xylulokinase
MAVSLGTSDTMFGSVADPMPSASEGHVFVNPVDPDAYMVMVVRQNGSLTREKIRNESAGGSWDTFAQLLSEHPPGNGGHIGFYFNEPEITPPVLRAGVHRFDAADKTVSRFEAAVDARAVVESEFLALRVHGAHVGLEPNSILVTGGASANEAIVRILADVFGVDVLVGEQANSAALGAAYRALHGWTCREKGRFVPFADVMRVAPPFRRAAAPDSAAHAAYTDMIERYERLENRVVRGR